MERINFNPTIPRYGFGRITRGFFPGLLWSGLTCLEKVETQLPRLPGEEWLRIKTRYGGICGSDLGAIHLETSPYFSSLTSFPFTFGHENTGSIELVGEKVHGWEAGRRVVVEPTLWCRPRGFSDLCRYCARGEINRCERTNQGSISPGLMVGGCRDTGGSWSSHYLAHFSQLYEIPVGINDENALLIEPFAVGLHAALIDRPDRAERILITGAGCIGLCTLAALRALGSKAEIAVLARHDFQRQAAIRLGADRVFLSKGEQLFSEVADFYAAEVLRPILGKSGMLGGADLVFECVGKTEALDQALKFIRSGGKVVLVGLPNIPKSIDWSPIFIHELTVQASYIYHHVENFQGMTWKTFDLAIEMMRSGVVDLGWLVTHKFRLEQYKQAFVQLHNRKEMGIIKAVFEF